MNELPPGTPRKRRRRRRSGRRWPLLALIVVACAGVLAAGTVAVAHSQWDAFLASCNLDGLQPKVALGADSFVYARDGSFLGAIPAKVHRNPVPLSKMSDWLPKATVAIEDRRFWQHGGVDFRGTLRAAVADLMAGRPAQGASTLDQQLADNLYLPGRPHGRPRAARQRPPRHRHERADRPPGRRQDRHDRALHRRVVHRLHAPADDAGVGRLREAEPADAGRPRHPRPGRELPGGDLAEVHAAGDEALEAGVVPAGGRRRVPAVARRPRSLPS